MIIDVNNQLYCTYYTKLGNDKKNCIYAILTFFVRKEKDK